MQNANPATKIKEDIVYYLRVNGPSLPVHIAKRVNQSPLFTSAFLSELYREGKIIMSHLKIGSSSLYLLKGQEEQLEKFIEHLNQREREAYNIIKHGKFLKDQNLEPVMRVAIRNIKDFAIPVKIFKEDQPQIIWKYFSIPEAEVENFINPKTEKIIEETKKEIIQNKASIEVTPPSTEIQPNPIPIIPPKIQKVNVEPRNKNNEAISLPFPESKTKETPKTEKPIESEFLNSIKKHLEKRKISISQIVLERKKELTAKVSLNSDFGKQDFFLIAKDKKRIKEEELIDALKQAHAEKMPALLIATGTLEKKAISTYEEWQNLIKFEKLL
ncbi:hypothetical protein COU54_05140 [Candidatus Pacearchaeota archaeon CG10_big_fil_rev_8_21_14_0_10_31_24]|nr:MAG: hypothetical protein COU54_05140 [Candidatus Pacearchaeota archaeon CG10_big_fil_rev_8_21_14_0_10_31_24]